MRTIRRRLTAPAPCLAAALRRRVRDPRVRRRRDLEGAHQAPIAIRGARLRPRPRHVAVRRRGCGPRGPGLPRRSRTSTTAARAGARPGDGSSVADQRRHHRRPRGAGPQRASLCATWTPAAHRAARQRRDALADPSPAKGGDRVGYLDRPLARVRRPRRARASSPRGGQPVTLVTPRGNRAYRGRLRSVAPDRRLDGARHRQRSCRWRATSRAWSRWRCRRSGAPSAVRAQAVAARTYAAYERDHPLRSDYQICDTCLLPGVRRGGRRAPRLQRRRGRDPAPGAACAAASRRSPSSAPARGGWTSAGSVSYLPARAGPVRRVVGQPRAHLEGALTDADLERDLAGDRQPDARSW